MTLLFMKKLFYILFVSVFLLSFPASASAVSVLLDGEPLNAVDQNGNAAEPFIYNGTTYAPVRAVASAFGTDISWDQATLTVMLGEKGGQPVRGDHINIYYNGAEFIAKDVNGQIVRPILKDGTTYLPIRSVGELFGKKVAWDSISQTAILSSPCSSQALAYFKKSASNTSAVENLKANITFNGSIYFENKFIGSVSEEGTEAYIKGVFSVSDILPDNYDENISYIGNGTYYFNVPPSKFMFTPYINGILKKRLLSCGFSSLSVKVSTKGAYITSVSVSGAANALYNNIPLHMLFSINASLTYPDGFEFSFTPYPPGDASESYDFTDDASSETEEISPFIKAYMKNLMNCDAKAISEMLYKTDYSSLFSSMSDSQRKITLENASSKLSAIFSECSKDFTVESMRYVDCSLYNNLPEKAVSITVSFKSDSDEDMRIEKSSFTLIKIKDKWYLDKATVESVLK